MSLGPAFLCFLMILGGLNPAESCSHAGKTPDFEKSTFSAFGGFFPDFGCDFNDFGVIENVSGRKKTKSPFRTVSPNTLCLYAFSLLEFSHEFRLRNR